MTQQTHRLRPDEIKISGVRAVLAVWQRRPDAVIRVYVDAERARDLGAMLSGLAQRRRVYHRVEAEELARVAGTDHHEGVCAVVRERPRATLDNVLRAGRGVRGPLWVLALDGVDNPHNVGAIARGAAHFGVPYLLIEPGSPGLDSPAAIRVAEGAAEAVDVVEASLLGALEHLHAAGWAVFATSSHGATSIFDVKFPPRTVLVLGSEAHGVRGEIVQGADARLVVPGTSAVQSLNVAAASAAMLCEGFRQLGPRGGR